MIAPESLRARRLVAFQMAVTGLLLVAAVILAGSAHAASTTIGRTWPIAEPDAMAEMEAKAAALPPDMAARFGPRSRWPALKAASLGRAMADRVRPVVPFYPLDRDIALPDGRILYPKGFTFNPLAFVALPQRLVIVDPGDLGWALATARPTDFILLTGSRSDRAGPQDDVLALSDRVHRPLFILEDPVRERLGLTVAPVIVAQQGQKLLLTEVGPEGRAMLGPAVRR
jgi:conjugal transfer pilus assembly protein TraW